MDHDFTVTQKIAIYVYALMVYVIGAALGFTAGWHLARVLSGA